jgi:hypothetical protein
VPPSAVVTGSIRRRRPAGVAVDRRHLGERIPDSGSRAQPEGRYVVTHREPRGQAVLVIANRTCPCPILIDEVARRASNGPIDVLVVAPALNSRLRHWLSDVDDALARARERLELALAELRGRGIGARGQVGDANPVWAIADALAHFPASAIVIATHPAGQSNWLERGLIQKARARFDVPITHLVSSYGLLEQGVAA